METKVLKIDWQPDKDGNTWLHLMVEDGAIARKFATENAERPLRVKLTRWTEKRSLTANAFAWVLMDKLSAKLGLSKEAIYRDYIRDLGGNTDTYRMPLKAYKPFRDHWENNGEGWMVDMIGASGPGMVDVMVYYGSSSFDTSTMARLIDLIIQDCREQGIEYLPPDKLAAMLEAWDEQKNASTEH